MSRRTIGSLLVRLGMDTKEADKAIKNFDRSLKNAARNMEGIGTRMTIGFTVPIVAGMRQAIKGLNEEAQAMKRLEVAIGGTSKALLDQAQAYHKTTLFQDDQIIAAQAYAAALGFGETSILKMTDAAVQLAAGLNIDLDSAMAALAKAAQGSGTALGKMLPEVKNLTKEQLLAGEATDLVAAKFKGYAEAAAGAGSGPLEMFNKKLADIGEELAKTALPYLEKFAKWLGETLDAFNNLSEGTKNFIVVFGGLVAASGPIMTYMSALPRLIKGTLDLADALSKMGMANVASGSALAILAALAGAAGTGALAGDMSGLFGAMEKNTGKEFGTWDKLKMGMSIGTGFNTLGGAAGVAQGMFMSTIKPSGSAAASPFWPSTASPYVMAPTASSGVRTLDTIARGGGGRSKASNSIALDMYANAFSPVGSQYAGVDMSAAALPMLSGGIQGGGRGLSADGMSSILPDMSQNLQTNMGFWRDWSSTVVGAIGEMGAALAEGENFFVAFGKTALTVANQVIQASIGKIIAQIVAGESGKGLVGALLGLAGAGVVVGLLSSMIGKSKSAAPKLADGGLAYGPTMAVVGDNPNARMDPEVISPLSKLKKMIGNAGAQTVQVVGVIRGDDILLQTSRANNYAIRRGAGNAITF